MSQRSHARRRRNPIVVALVVLAVLLSLAFLALAAIKLVPGLFGSSPNSSDGSTTLPLTIGESETPAAHIVPPKGWNGAPNEETGIFEVHSPNGVLTSTVVPAAGAYDAVFADYLAQHPQTAPTRWEMLGSGLPVVHAMIGNCNYAVVQSSPQMTVTLNSCVPEGTDMNEYAPAISELLEGVRP